MPTQSIYQQPSDQTLQIVKELRDGQSYGTLAKRYGLTKQRIGQIAKRHGIARRKTPIDIVPDQSQ